MPPSFVRPSAAPRLAGEPGQRSPYASAVVVSLGFRRDKIAHPLDGFGLVVPATEGAVDPGCQLWQREISASGGPEGSRCCCGCSSAEPVSPSWSSSTTKRSAGWSWPRLGQLLEGCSRRADGLRRRPAWRKAQHAAISSRPLGAGRAEDRAAGGHAASPGVLAGNAYHGVGIAQCIRSGEQAALVPVLKPQSTRTSD